MKRSLISVLIMLTAVFLAGCSLTLLGKPTPLPTPILQSTPTPLPDTPTPAATDTSAVPSETPILNLPSPTPGLAATAVPATLVPTSSSVGIQPGNPSGPYGVIRIGAADVLNIRSGPGVAYSISGSFGAQVTNVMRTGPYSNVGQDLWVQVQKPDGTTGWVNASYLTEYMAPATFCADNRVNSLLANFGNDVKTSSGQALAGMVSPAHGMTVRLWRNGNAVTFDQAHSQWIFSSTYVHNWGAAPGSGLDTLGAIHEVVLPKWLDVLNGSFTLSCNLPQTGGASYDTSWPATYANINFYSLYKPGPAGNENSWRTLLVGVEYVQGQPYIFSVTQLEWEP
jgi:hypothetical protein